MAAIVNNLTKDKEQQEEGVQKPSINLSAGGSAMTGAPANTTPAFQGSGGKPASSGRFTNLQSYLGANKGAGEKIANVVGQGINKNLGQQKETEATEAAQFRNAVEASKNVNQQGQTSLGQISDSNFDPTQIASNADALKSFTDLRKGTAQQSAAEAASKEGGEAQNALTGLQQAYSTTTKQIQDPNERYNLLKQYLAAPKTQYGRGLSSLDNALLQSDPNKSLQGINKQITQEQQQVGKERADMLSQQQSQSQVAKEQGTKLASDIQAKTVGNEAAMVKGLEDKITGANEARVAEQAWANDQYAKLNKGEAIDQKFADMLGLTQGQKSYGVFQNMQDPSELLNMSPAQITSVNQLATDQDRARYAALAQLAGIDESGYRVGDALAIDPSVATKADWNATDRLSQAQQNILANQMNAGPYISGSLTELQQSVPGLAAALQSGTLTPEQKSQIQSYMKSKDSAFTHSFFAPQAQSAFDQLKSYLANQGFYNTVNIAKPGSV